MAKDRDSDTSAASGQSKRPPMNHHVSHDSDSQVSDQASAHHRQKNNHHPQQHRKPAVTAGRLHSRVPSTKALQKVHNVASAVKLAQQLQSAQQATQQSPDDPSMVASAHRRTHSDVRLSRDSSASNLRKNQSHTSLKRNRSHVDVGKKSKSGANIKRSSSHKDVAKLKSNKGTVHFDLGNDGQDDEWVDASGSASPFLSRRGSVVSSGSAARPEDEEDDVEEPPRPQTPPRPEDTRRVQQKEYLTSRLLQRTPLHGAPPKMSADIAHVPPHSASPDSSLSRASSTIYDSPRAGTSGATAVADEPTSRFVSGPGSGVNPDSGSFYSPAKMGDRVKRPRSLGNLQQDHRTSIADEPEEEDDSALAPRSTRRTEYRAAPAEKSRTQQKLNLQRASSTIEPVPAGSGGVGAVGASPLIGGAGYDNRDPRIGKLIERTGMEYLVVRRYQNPVARSLARLQQLPGAGKTQHIPKQNGTNGSLHSKKPSDGHATRYNTGLNTGDTQRSRPTTGGGREASIRTNGANSSYEAEDGRVRISGSSFVVGGDDDVAALLRNLWDKSLDLSASQD